MMIMMMMNVEEHHNSLAGQVKKGTTTVGIMCKDGIILAADKKATAFYTENRNEKKVFPINQAVVMTTAGSVGDLQYLYRVVKAEAALSEMRSEVMSATSVATLLSNILNNTKYFPYMVALLVGGYDEGTLPVLYSVDAIGGATRGEKIVVTGSGGPIALGVLQSQFRENISIDDAKVLAVKALVSARERDVYTGGKSLDIAVITPEGVSLVKTEDINKLIEKEQATLA